MLPICPVYEGVVVGELDEWLLPDLEDPVDLAQDVGNRLLLVAVGEDHRTGAELAAMGTAAARLHGQAVVARDFEQFVGGNRCLAEIEIEGTTVVQPFESPSLEVAQKATPDWLTFPHHHGVAVQCRLARKHCGVRTADDDRCSLRPVPVRERVGFLDLGAERRDGHEIEAAGEIIQCARIRNLQIRDLVLARRERRQGQQPETRKGGNHLAALHEAG